MTLVIVNGTGWIIIGIYRLYGGAALKPLKPRRRNTANFVDELKKDHNVLIFVLDEAKTLGVTSMKGQQKLISAKDAFLRHLKKEDELLYPVLRKAAEKNKELRIPLETFAADMDGISKTVMDFFGKYAAGGDSSEFCSDSGRLYAALKSRIRREENVLYKEYEKIS